MMRRTPDRAAARPKVAASCRTAYRKTIPGRRDCRQSAARRCSARPPRRSYRRPSCRWLLAAATQFLVQASLQQWLGDLIEVNDVQVISSDASLLVEVLYTVRRTQQQQLAQFSRGGTLQ